MLVYATLKLEHFSLRYDHAPEWIEKTQSKGDFQSLLSDIQTNGIQDPLLSILYPNRLEVEKGQRRLLAARILKIPTLHTFIYESRKGHMPADLFNGTRITKIEKIFDIFKNSNVLVYQDILGYVRDGIIML